MRRPLVRFAWIAGIAWMLALGLRERAPASPPRIAASSSPAPHAGSARPGSAAGHGRARDTGFMGSQAAPVAPANPPSDGIAIGAEWSSLLDHADSGDPHAACELALLLEDCRLATD